MPYDPERHHRRSIRLHGYDYSLAGAYFITICAQNHVCLFTAPPVIEMIDHWWLELEHKFPAVVLDAFVVMPNHVHGIVVLDPPEFARPTLGEVVQWFKTMTTNAYIKGVKGDKWKAFAGRLWQRNYYEHIIRNDPALHAIRQYIEANPENWEKDKYYPGPM